MAHEMEQSRKELAGVYEGVQLKAFTNWVNSHLIKAGQKISNLSEDFKDGTKLLLLLELLTNEKLPRDKGNLRVHYLQNVQHALDFLQLKRKIKLVNIRNNEIVDGNQKLILGLIWTLILHFQICIVVQPDERSTTGRPTSPKEISAKAIKDHMLHWAQAATNGYEEVSVTNFHTSWRNGMAFCAILDRHRPDLLDYDDCDPDKPLENLEKAFRVAEKELGILRIVDPEDVCVKKPDDKTVMTYLSFLQQAFPDMPPPRKRKGPVSSEEYADIYDSLREWLNEKEKQAMARELPSSTEDLRKELEQLERAKKEITEKKKDMVAASSLHDLLEAQHKKKSSNPGVPEGKEFPQLQEDWNRVVQAVDARYKALQEELERCAGLDVLASKILSTCDKLSPVLKELEEDVVELEENISSMEPAEMAGIVANLTSQIKELLDEVGTLKPDVETLKEGKYHDADYVATRVQTHHSQLESLLPRIQDASLAASEVQWLANMEKNLLELEVWLVTSGKFSSNQHILHQIQAHKAFEEKRLSKMEEFTKLSSSTPPPGMEAKVEEMAERFKRVVKQTKERLLGLDPILDRVLEFDTLKNSLEDWCLQQQELIEQLSPLEVTEEQLLPQQKECEALLDAIVVYSDSILKLEEIATQFFRETEPVQRTADRYARKIQTNLSVQCKMGENDLEPSLGEQASILEGLFEWLKCRISERSSQISDLLDKLSQFNQHHNDLCKFVAEGNRLLDSEKPVRDSAAQVQEQMDTCQDFRTQISSKQATVDVMLCLGREILAEPNTSSASDGLMQKLTSFITEWSDLQLNWQNWFDKLHAGVEQSINLFDQLKTFSSDIKGLGMTCSRLFPISVSMKNFDKELLRLQTKFNSEVLRPYNAYKVTYQKLQSGLCLLPDQPMADEVFKKFDEMEATVEGLQDELSVMIRELSGWWSGCDGVCVWLGEVEETMVSHKPLASSMDIIDQQMKTLQSLVNGVESHKEDLDKSLKALGELSQHDKVLEVSPVASYKATLDRRWKALSKDIETRTELCQCSKDYISSYADGVLPFVGWLKGVELGMELMETLPRSKDLLMEEKDEMKAFCEDMKVHGENLTQIEIKGSSFLGSAKTYQRHLQAYQRKVDPDLAATLSKNFVDLRMEDLTSGEVETNNFEGMEYQNGIRVVAGNSAYLRRRYDALNAIVKQRQQLVNEAVVRRKEFDGCMAILGNLADMERRFESLEFSGESLPLKVQEKMEFVRTLEVECLAMEPKLQDLQAKYDILDDLGQMEKDDVVWEGEDEALQEKEEVEQRHRDLLEKLQLKKDILSNELSNAQAFHGTSERFATWLRTTERKIQRDDPLKLEENELKSGLKHLKETARDIEAHRTMYKEMCGNCEELIDRGVQDMEDLQSKLNNVQQRWNAIQFVGEDIEVIETTIPRLEAFHITYAAIVSDVDVLLHKIDQYSVSAISNDVVRAKNDGLQLLCGEIEGERLKFEGAVVSCELLTTPFDQSQFEIDVRELKDCINHCDKMLSDKKSELKALERKVRPMEDLFAKFSAWLASSEAQLTSLEPRPSPAKKEERERASKEAESIRDNTIFLKTNLEELECSMEDVFPLLDEVDQEELKGRLDEVTVKFNLHVFACEGHLVEKWIEDKEAELSCMRPSGMQVTPLQDQLSEVQEFDQQVSKHKQDMDNLSLLASLAEPSNEGAVHSKMADLQARYERLQALPALRQGVLEDFLPAVQQYESSRGAWLDLLCDWEENVAKLPSLMAKPKAIQTQLSQIKAIQQAVNDHEPEFISLKREVQILCDGPPSIEATYFDKVTPLCMDDCPVGRDLSRPGQKEQIEIIIDYERRLVLLRKELDGQSAGLSSQLEKAKEFESLTSGLTVWLGDVEGGLGKLKIRDPNSGVIRPQLQKCQTLVEQRNSRLEGKEKMSPLFLELTCGLPSDSKEGDNLQNQLDDLNKRWMDLSRQLSLDQTSLETALELATTTEGSMKKLNPWVPQTLQHLESLGPPPAEPEKVEQLKAELEGLKVEYNSLAPAHASCMEDGHSLTKICEDGVPRSELEVNITDLRDMWEKLDNLFAELNEKFTAALVQTQEFQGVAKGLERWMSGIDELLCQQDRIAVRCRLVEPQMEAFKHILSDIKSYSSTLEQSSSLGQSLMEESNMEEKEKIKARLASLTSRFEQLQDASQSRLTHLEVALKTATSFEDQCNKFEIWLCLAEEKMEVMPPFAMVSQPLKTQLEQVEEFVLEIEAHQPDLESATKAEQELLDSELSSIKLCEELLSATKLSSSLSSSSPAKDSLAFPNWFERPGAPEVVETRADLNDRFNRLNAKMTGLKDEGKEFLGKVVSYEDESGKFRSWLTEKKDILENLAPPCSSVEEIQKQLNQVLDLQEQFNDQDASLESVSMQGTALVDRCLDELSGASGRLTLSDLNESWGDTLATLVEKEKMLKEGLALAEDYQSQYINFEDWLSKPEEELAKPLRLEGDPRAVMRQLDALRELLAGVKAHQPQLESLISAGQALETFAGVSPSLSYMDYATIQDRYHALKSLEDRLSALENTLDRVSNFRGTLNGLLEQLKGMRAKLNSHEPPHVTPPAVEDQAKDLMVLDKIYSELAPALSKCKEEGRSYMSLEIGSAGDEDASSGVDIQSLLSAVSLTSTDVQGLLDHWRDLLASSLETAKKFDNDSTDLSTWVRGKKEGLAAVEVVRGIPEGVQKQLEEVQMLQEELIVQEKGMDELSSLCHSMTENCSTKDSLLLGERQSQLTGSFEGLQRSMLDRNRVLKDGMVLAADFAISWTDCMSEINRKMGELEELEAVGVDIDTVKIQLDSYKEFEVSLAEVKPMIISALSQGKKLRESCSSRDKPFIKEQIDKLNAAWSQLHSSGLERKHKLEDALLQLGQFHDALGELLMWITNCTARLMEARPPGVEPSSVEGQVHDLETIQSGVSSHAPSVASLNTAGERLLNSSSSAESTLEVQQDLADLNARWAELQELASDRNAVLVEAMEKTSDFHSSWKYEVGWLAEAETKAYTDWKPCGLPETCEADLLNHEHFYNDVKAHEAQIEVMRAKGNTLKIQGSPEDKKMVDRWIGDLLKRYDDLNFTLEEKKAQLEDAAGRAVKFDDLYGAMGEVVVREEGVQANQAPIHSDVEAVKEQMEKHKEHLKALSELEGQFEELDGWGQLLIKECVTPDGEVIQQRLDDLRVYCDALISAATERQAVLEESLLSLGQFEEAYDDLWVWLVGAIKQLEEFEAITGDPDAVSTQLAKHKSLQKQLGAHLASKNAVVRAGRQLMKFKTGEDKALLKKKLQSLEKEWEKVCQVSVDRQDQLDNAYMMIAKFRSHVAPMWSWMEKVLPSLDKSEPVHGDIGTVETLSSTHNSLQKDLDKYIKTVDAANESGQQLIKEILDEPTITKEDMDKLNCAWEELCQQSVDKQDRLNEALTAAEKFEEGYSDIISWVNSEVSILQSQSEPDEDATILLQQIEDNNELVQEVATRQLDYDRVHSEGEGLLQLAHPKAVPVLETKLQQLQKKWLNLRGKMGPRSEALASAQLELHGLQDMLDNLLSWITDAEGEMRETEAMPIGIDMEAVEAQLASHEAFQEDMAAKQPNMDALNKAARKRKANHSSPDLVKKIASLHKHWQKLWLRSGERHRQLLEARTRLKDIALARSFDFDKWKKRFLTLVNQQKLRVSDLFRRFDGNHDGMLTREEFMKALKASGLAMNQIELEKIADSFDKDRSGTIDLREIVSVLKGGSRQTRRPVVQETLTDQQKIDNEIQLQVSHCKCDKKFQVTRIAEGQYRFGDNQKLRMVRILRSTVMVRVGGGWEPLDEFLKKHDPCRASGRTNAEMRSLLNSKGPGLSVSSFSTKTQKAINAKRGTPARASNGDAQAGHTHPHHRTTRDLSLASPKHKPASPKHKPATQTRNTPSPKSMARSSTPIKRTRTPVSRSTTPVPMSSQQKRAVSPLPTAILSRRTTPSSSRASTSRALASNPASSKASRIPAPPSSKIPTITSKVVTKQT